MNLIAQLEIELTYYNVAVQYVDYYTIGTPLHSDDTVSKLYCSLPINYWYIYICVCVYVCSVCGNTFARAGSDTRSVFLKQVWIQNFSSPWPVAIPRLKSALTFISYLERDRWIPTFPKCISAMWIAISLVLDFELWLRCPFPTTMTITSRVPIGSVLRRGSLHWQLPIFHTT